MWETIQQDNVLSRREKRTTLTKEEALKIYKYNEGRDPLPIQQDVQSLVDHSEMDMEASECTQDICSQAQVKDDDNNKMKTSQEKKN